MPKSNAEWLQLHPWNCCSIGRTYNPQATVWMVQHYCCGQRLIVRSRVCVGFPFDSLDGTTLLLWTKIVRSRVCVGFPLHNVGYS